MDPYLFKLLSEEQARPTPRRVKVDNQGRGALLDGNLKLLRVHLRDSLTRSRYPHHPLPGDGSSAG
eukprot:917404-Prorocentrum_minimum.AAC.3